MRVHKRVHKMTTKSKNPEEVVSDLRNTFVSGRTKPLEYRIKQLKAFKRMLEENLDKIADALYKDLHKCRHESIITEIDILINETKYTLTHLHDWARTEKPSKEFANSVDSVYILHDPFGVVLIMGAWNYPLQLSLGPVIGAIAAGNCILVKPSELSPASSKFIADYFPKYLDEEAYQVIEGGIPESTEVLKQKFDYIFYTGSTAVGKIVHAAANKNLTATTLELGGKSPVYLDKSADMEKATRRILWGKTMNAGQTCLAPDYVLCTKEVQDKFIACAKKVLREFFGDDPKSSPDYGRIVNERHFKRVSNLLKGCDIAIGGQIDASENYIAPTIIRNANLSDPVMQEEIFGPLLPLFIIENAHDAINLINKGEKPLALYVLSNNKSDIKLFLTNTSSGGVTVNDTVMHFSVFGLPFGGVGHSGMGSYHGKYSYDTFTHKKSVLHKNFTAVGEILSAARYPPFTSGKLTYLRFMLTPGSGPSLGQFSHLIMFGLGIVSVYVFKYIMVTLQEKAYV